MPELWTSVRLEVYGHGYKPYQTRVKKHYENFLAMQKGVNMKFKGILARDYYSSPAAMRSQFRKWKKRNRRVDRAPFFKCLKYLKGFHAFSRCRIKEVFCCECGAKMYRGRGFFCDYRPELDRCDRCGCCDTGTDEDFDRYAVEVQNGEGYYDASGKYRSFRIYDD